MERARNAAGKTIPRPVEPQPVAEAAPGRDDKPGAKPAERAIAQLTPMMRQYLEVKGRYPDAILFFRLGDFYEMFFEDAIKASEILQITLTSRSKGEDRIPMCGVPHHSIRGHIAKLVEAGLKVAICDQVEEAGQGTIVKRDVTRVVTPGMVLDEELLDSRANHYLAAVSLGQEGGGLALLDASTGDFYAGQFPTDEALAQELSRTSPREILLPAAQLDSERVQRIARTSSVAALNPFADEAFEVARAEALLKTHFGTLNLDGYGVGDKPHALAAAGAALRYLRETQKAGAAHVNRLGLLTAGEAMALDEATLSNLEVHRTQRENKRKGSLLGLLDRSATALGGRRLARWLTYPLLDLEAIRARHDAVGELVERGVLRDELLTALREVSDLERLTARLSLGQGNGRDLRSLALSLAKLPELAKLLEQCDSALLREQLPALGALPDLQALLERAVAEEPPATLKEGGLIRQGYDAKLDELVEIATRGKDWLLRLETQERERTKIASLKVRYNRVFGYYIEVTKANLHLVPKDYVRKQTTANGERYVTEALKEFEEKVLTAEEKRYALEFELFEKLRLEVVKRSADLRAAADAVAVCDALLALARVATEYGYVRPECDDSDVLEIVEGRHPVVERMLGEQFVPNDIRLDGTTQQVVVITGPNMAGKSTVMRQVALTVLMAQAGSFVPARRARIGLCDRIFTRVGAADNLSRGQSTFMVEMTETANILNNATRRSLVILDEIGRGTSTFDGLSIAWAVAEFLHDVIGARTLFATHYHELVELAREKPRVKNASIAVKEWEGKVIFLRKLVAGGASRSYGIEVARLAGLPATVLGRAREILQNLERAELDDAGRPPAVRGSRRRSTEQLSLFVREGPPPEYEEIAETLKSVSIDDLTPLKALNLLAELKSRLG